MPPARSGRRNESSSDDGSRSSSDESSDDASSSDDSNSSSSSDDDGDSSDGSSTSSASSSSKPAVTSAMIREAIGHNKADLVDETAAKQRADAAIRYRQTDSIWHALQGTHTRLLRMSYLITLAKRKQVLQRRQDLPEHAFISLLHLQRVLADASPLITNIDGALPIVAVSACWQSKSHPDPKGEQLRTVGAILERESSKYHAAAPGGVGFSEMGVFWDWGSLMQPELSGEDKGSRKPAEQGLYDAALQEMDLWYGHEGTVVLMLTRRGGGEALRKSMPRTQLRKKARTYEASGWTTYEGTAARLKQFVRANRIMQAASWRLVIDAAVAVAEGEGEGEGDASGGGSAVDDALGKARVSAAPEVMGTRAWQFDLDRAGFGERLSKKLFAKGHEGDAKVCERLYDMQSAAQLGGLTTITMDGTHVWPRAGAREAAMLGRLVHRRMCGRLQEVRLQHVSGLGDAFGSFCTALAEGGELKGPLSNHLASLLLDGNSLSDANIESLAAAAKAGALRALTHLSLSHNLISLGARALAAVSVDWPGSLSSLQDLKLYDNRLGEKGAVALAAEFGRGALHSLRSLYLGANAMGPDGCAALADAFLSIRLDGPDGAGSTLPHLQRLHLFENGVGKRGATALGKALHRDTFDEATATPQPFALPRCTEIILDGNGLRKNAVRFVKGALRRREWARLVLRTWRMSIREQMRTEMAERAALLSSSAELLRTTSSSEVSKHALSAPVRKSVAVSGLAQWYVGSSVNVE
jgi:hypothetical protein